MPNAGDTGTEGEGMNPDNTDETSTSGPASEIAGLWDSTLNAGDQFFEDVIYVNITPSGVFTDYNFQGDVVDAGDNCYTVFSTTPTPLGNNQFQFNFFGRELVQTFTRNGDTLTVEYVDFDDDDFDGDTTDLITETYQRLTGISTADLTRCS